MRRVYISTGLYSDWVQNAGYGMPRNDSRLLSLAPDQPDLNLYAEAPFDASLEDINNSRSIHRNRHPVRHLYERHVKYQVQVILKQLLLLH